MRFSFDTKPVLFRTIVTCLDDNKQVAIEAETEAEAVMLANEAARRKAAGPHVCPESLCTNGYTKLDEGKVVLCKNPTCHEYVRRVFDTEIEVVQGRKHNIGQAVMEEIIKQPMFTMECPDSPQSGCLAVWNGNAAEQIEAIIFNYKGD